MAKKYVIRIQKRLVEVEKTIYYTYYGMKRKEKTLWEKDERNGVFLFSNLDTGETTGEEAISDSNAPSIEDIVVEKLMVENLHCCIKLLDQAEQELINALFFQCLSEREYAKLIGISQKGINKRRTKILSKLRKLMKI